MMAVFSRFLTGRMGSIPILPLNNKTRGDSRAGLAELGQAEQREAKLAFFLPPGAGAQKRPGARAGPRPRRRSGATEPRRRRGAREGGPAAPPTGATGDAVGGGAERARPPERAERSGATPKPRTGASGGAKERRRRATAERSAAARRPERRAPGARGQAAGGRARGAGGIARPGQQPTQLPRKAPPQRGRTPAAPP